MEALNSFNGGLFKDLEPISQPKGTYRHLLNAVRNIDGSPVNEAGTTSFFSVKGGYEVVAMQELDGELIIISTTGYVTDIGILDITGQYIEKISTTQIPLATGILVSCVVKKDYRGHRLIYFTNGVGPVRRVDLDDTYTSEDIDQRTKLFLEYKLPVTEVVGVSDTGNLPSGIYQVTARLVTKEMNPTAFSLVTNPVPIVNESTNGAAYQVDGALPQTPTGKSIKVKFSNLDPTYEYLEIAVVTYVGTENAIKVNLLPLQPIRGRESFEFTYSDTTQNNTEITLNELLQEYAHYDNAQHIMEKDGFLLLANLTSEESKYNFQEVANNIAIRWTEEILYGVEQPLVKRYIEGVQDGEDHNAESVRSSYKNELIAATKVSYMRGEAYSFALVPIFKGKKFGNEYHIPARAVSNFFGNRVVYKDADYNAEFLLSNIFAADPTTKELGCKISSLRYPPGQGYPDTPIRYHVMPTISQSPLMQMGGYAALGIEVDEPAFTVEHKEVLEGWMIVRRHRSDEHKTIISQGIAQNLVGTGGTDVSKKYLVPTPATGKWPAIYNDGLSELKKKEVAFYSPESIILEKDLSSAVKLEVVANMKGKLYPIADKRAGGREEEYAHLYAHYDRIESVAGMSTLISAGSIHYIPKDNGADGSFTGVQGKEYALKEINGYLTFTTVDDLPVNNRLYNGKPEFQFEYKSGATSNAWLVTTGGTPTDIGSTMWDNNNGGETDRYLYNMVTNRPAQYGEVYEGQYMYVGHRLFSENKTGPLKLFGGDTFIGKIGIVSTTCELDGALDKRGLHFRTLNYFPVESTINVNYRHYITGVETEDGIGTVPYFPKKSKLWTKEETGLLQVYPLLGHCKGYNRQYSFVNTIRPFFPKGLGQVDVSDYSNRVVYSSKGIESEQYDSYRTFLVNNYHDIPRGKGAITDIFEHRGGLYIHTAQSLFRALFNEQTTQATSSGEIYLGNGGLFPLPSKEMLTVKGGFAGTQNKWASCETQFGRFFVDEVRKTVFMLDEFPMDISSFGMSSFFFEGLVKGHMVSTYDTELKRWILCTPNFTISYSPLLKSWSSLHSYKGHAFSTFNNKLLVTEQDKPVIYTLNTGEYGKYFEQEVQPLEIEFVSNEGADTTKVFDNLVLYVTATSPAGISLPYDTFTSMQFYNELQHSGLLTTYVPKTFMDEFEELGHDRLMLKKKGKEFRLAVPFDMVIDINSSIFDVTNLATDTSFKPRFTDKYLVIRAVYDNFANNKLQFNAAKVNFRISSR